MYSKRFKKLVSIIMIVTMVMANVNLNCSALFENNKKENVEVQAKEEQIPETGIELPYLLCLMLMTGAVAVLIYLKKTERIFD